MKILTHRQNQVVFLIIAIGTVVLSGCIPSDVLAIPNYEPLHQFGLGVIYDTAWNPIGDKIAVATSLGIRFHQPDTLKEVDFWATETSVTALIYKRDGTLISGEQSGRITLWNNQGRAASVLSGPSTPCSLTISPDEHWLAIPSCVEDGLWSPQEVEVWNLTTETLAHTFATQNYSLRGVAFASQSNEVILFETGYGQCHWSLTNGKPTECQKPFCDGLPCGPQKIIANQASSRLAYQEYGGGVFDRLWNSEGNNRSVWNCENCTGRDIQYSPKSSKLAAGRESEILIIDVVSSEITTHITDTVAYHFEFSPNEERFVAVTCRVSIERSVLNKVSNKKESHKIVQ